MAFRARTPQERTFPARTNRQPHMRPPGYLLDGLREFIADLPNDCSIFEIGSYRGESAREFLTKCRQIVCIDPWFNYNERNGEHTDGIHDSTEAEREFDQLLYDHPARIIKLKMHSTAAALILNGQTADVIYIDGNHEAPHLEADIRSWLPHCKKPGILAIHDYGHAQFTGVKEACDRLLIPPHKVYQDTTAIWRLTTDGTVQR